MSQSQHVSTSQRPPEPTGRFEWAQAPWGWVLHCTPFAGVALHFFTARDFSPGRGHGSDAGGWEQAAQAAGVPIDRLWRLDQVHGCRTVTVATAVMPADAPLERADAVVTACTDAALAVKTADCVPILLADRGGRVIGAVHAGWRGTASRVVADAVSAMARAGRVDPAECLAAIGPSIGACCYDVGPEVRVAFSELGHAPAVLDRWFTGDAGDGRARLDLWQANRDQLVEAGLDPAHIHVAGLCTVTHLDWFFSYRREGPRAGRMLAVIRRADPDGP